jgi:hypothetical protein
MKQLSRYAGDGEGNEKMITYYKQMVVSKDCEINTFRETTSRLENIIYEREVEIEKYRSEIIRERDSLNKAHACEIARIT